MCRFSVHYYPNHTRKSVPPPFVCTCIVLPGGEGVVLGPLLLLLLHGLGQHGGGLVVAHPVAALRVGDVPEGLLLAHLWNKGIACKVLGFEKSLMEALAG